MPKVYLKIDAQFTITDLQGPATKVAEEINRTGPEMSSQLIELQLQPTVRGCLAGFGLGRDEVVDASITAKADGSTLTVECKGIFAISPRPQYTAAVLDPKAAWYLSGISYHNEEGESWSGSVNTAIRGLTAETLSEYNDYSKKTDTRKVFRATVQVAKKAKDLK